MNRKYLLLGLAFFIALASSATTITAVNSGKWETASTWNIPSNWNVEKDTVIIPPGVTVTVNSNIDLTHIDVLLQDNGVLKFVASGDKLNLSPASMVMVGYSGVIQATGSPSQVLNIGNNPVYKGSDPNIIGLSYATSTTSGFVVSSILPVRFTDVTVSRQSNQILVKWVTAQETESKSFEIERSLDGNNWTKAGTVAAAGTSATTRTYTYTDQGNSAKVLYRIKEVDLNGQFIYSIVKCVSATTTAGSTVNIASSGEGKVLLQFAHVSDINYTVRIVSLNGQVLSQQQLSSPSGAVMLPVSLKGAYVVAVSDGKSLQVAKQVIL
ncbi:MAG TPA: hypothetical protein VNS32_14695 [Flavisolibacter sp.]|nr:hypothetical protein [Flavisolibacter sp.]